MQSVCRIADLLSQLLIAEADVDLVSFVRRPKDKERQQSSEVTHSREQHKLEISKSA